MRIGMDMEMFGKAFAFVFVALVVGVFAARVADTRSKSAAASAAISAAPVSAPELRSNSRSVTLSRQWLPFWVEPKIDGRPLQMVVDTGATQIALRASDAARLGIHPTARDYVVKVATANGDYPRCAGALRALELGDIVVRDLSALVHADDVLGVNLLGMSFLSRLRWTHERGRLVLEQ